MGTLIVMCTHDTPLSAFRSWNKLTLIKLFILFSPSHLHTVVSLLTYLLTKKELTPEEVVGVAIDVVFAGVDTVSICTDILITKREGQWYCKNISPKLIVVLPLLVILPIQFLNFYICSFQHRCQEHYLIKQMFT